MLKRASFILIGVAFAVLLSANLYVSHISGDEQKSVEQLRDETTYRYTRHGDVVGFIDRYGARSWQGIPYAKPPVDDLRWRSPEPPDQSYDLLETLVPGSPCPQFSGSSVETENATSQGLIGNEDCLFLNVWAPPNAVDLPVMVWIHGGGNTIGDGGTYSGAWLAANREVVVVTINYRLGVFGWFSHPKLDQGNEKDSSGNFGTLDIIRSLEWVNENITEFGGNPDNVTIFGESAGGFNVLSMIASPLASGLFHKAIVQSGGLNLTTKKRAEDFFEEGGHRNSSSEILSKLLIEDGIVDNAELAKKHIESMTASDVSEYLYSKSPSEIFRVLKSGGFGMLSLPDIFRDGHVIPDYESIELFSSADLHNVVPTILGTNRDEPSLFMIRNPRYVDTYFGVFPRIKDKNFYKQTVKYGALAWKVRGVDSIANAMSLAGNSNVYAYRFDWDEEPSQYGFDLSLALGAAHALEIPFVFGDFENRLFSSLYPNDDAQKALSQSMTSYWTEFAYSGDPGKGRNGQNPHWAHWKEDGLTSLVLDTANDAGIRMIADEYTMDSVRADFLNEEFTDDGQKCELYKATFRGQHFIQTEYENLVPTKCN